MKKVLVAFLAVAVLMAAMPSVNSSGKHCYLQLFSEIVPKLGPECGPRQFFNTLHSIQKI